MCYTKWRVSPSWFAALGIALAASFAHAETPADLKLPPGTRTSKDGQLVSAKGLRDATDFIAKDLAKRGIAATQIGPYRVRGVELTRFISNTPTTTWLAIHVVRISGKTVISFVLRPEA